LQEADLILHAGDLVSLAFLEELSGIGPPVEAVYGNMDEPAVRELLPYDRILDVERARIGMVHIAGPRAGRERRLIARFPGCQAIVYGHTHVPQVERFEDIWILNPGSPTERRSADSRSMLMLRVANGRVEPEFVRLT
jgi:putative phosphoesterase